MSALILVVDDDIGIRQLIELVLTKMGGFEVISAGSGAEARHQLGSRLPHLVLLDLVLPDLDGRDFLREIREHSSWQGLDVVICTGREEEEIHQELRDLGALGIIVKPVNPTSLVSQVRAWLER